MKKTAVAPSNIAFIKYWGKKDENLRLPENGSVSMNLSDLLTTTTVEFNPGFKTDIVIIDGRESGDEKERVLEHMEKIKSLARVSSKVKVVSRNNFPSGTGLSSSASAFAALTLAAASAAGLSLSEKELSILARQGSGSACRSIPDGFVEWLNGDTSNTSYAISLYPASYWNLADVVVLTESGKKEVSSTEGQKLVNTSPFFEERKKRMEKKIRTVKEYLKNRDFTAFGELIEEEALELHSIMLTSNPSLIYLLPNTLRIILEVKKWRREGLEVYFTLNTGQDVHLICEEKNVAAVVKKARAVEGVRETIINRPCVGARLSDSHLF